MTDRFEFLSHWPARAFGLLFALVAMLALAGCADTYQWHQRLTVEVDTPEGVKSGSSVVEVRWQEKNAVGNYPGSYRGEATMVDLGERGVLFALLGEQTRYLAMRTFGKGYGITEEGFAATEALRGVGDVPSDWYPLLVTFTDIDDPKTVKRVDPGDLAATFGPGYALKRMTLEITDAPVTEGQVEQVLGWWNNEQLFEQLWPNISRDTRSLLSSVNWKKE